jgi:hypothetical protein
MSGIYQIYGILRHMTHIYPSYIYILTFLQVPDVKLKSPGPVQRPGLGPGARRVAVGGWPPSPPGRVTAD